MLDLLQRHAGEVRWDAGLLAGSCALATVIGLASVGLSPSTLMHWLIATVVQTIAL